MRLKLVCTLAIVCAVVAAVAALPSAATSTPRASKAPIQLDLIADMDFPPAGISHAGTDLAAEAAIKAVNAAGGVNGHPLKLSVCNTRGDGNVANSCARAAVASKSVADVGGFNFFGTPMAIMNAGHLPMIGRTPGFTVSDWALPTAYPYFAVALTGMSGAVYTAIKTLHEKKVAVISTAPASSLYYAAAKTEAKRLGGSITATLNASPGADLTPVALAAQKGGAQAIAVVTPLSPQVIAAIRQNGIKLPIVSSLEPGDAKNLGSAGNGVYSILPHALPSSNAPGVKQMNKEMDAYKSGIPRTLFSLGGWLAVHQFVDVAKKLKTVNRASIQAAFGHLHNQYAYDIIPPYSTTKKFKGLGGHYPDVYNQVLYLGRDENGKLVIVNPKPFFPF